MWVKLGLILGIVVLLAVYYLPYFSSTQKSVSAYGPFSLDKEETVIAMENSAFLLDPSAATFQAFVYLNPLMKTGTYAECGTNPNQPSCADGTFGPCPCVAQTGDCSICDHKGYARVFSLAGLANLEILVAPDASRQGKAMSQLTIKTETSSVTSGVSASQKYLETLQLPPIPFQKWTMITVAREGRRFDIYYNDELVLSQKTLNMPISSKIDSSMRGVVSGSDGLVGRLAVATASNYRYDIFKVTSSYRALSDTRGRPFLDSDKTIGLLPDTSKSAVAGWNPLSWFGLGALPTPTLCPPEGCINAPAVRPSNPIYDWSQNFG